MEKWYSDVPNVAMNEPCYMGIDEAGRGPVLGPMVYATCYCPISQKDIVNELGFADSKTLTEESRNILFEKLQRSSDKIGWIAEILMPTFISNSMLKRTKYNLNEISHDTAIGLVRRTIALGVDIKEVYVDTVGDVSVYQRKLEESFPSLKITVAKKADSLYPIVSAASICAKVTRDKIVSTWKFVEDVEVADMDYGSGYPSDAKTKQFLSDTLDPVFGFTSFVRFSWSTADINLREKGVPVHWEDDETDEVPAAKRKRDISNVPPLTAFFTSTHTSNLADSIKNPALPRHRFLKNCGLMRVENM